MSNKEKRIDQNKKQNSFNEEERRISQSEARGAGYHAPTEQDVEDIRKDHRTSTVTGGLNADAAMRDDEEDVRVGEEEGRAAS